MPYNDLSPSSASTVVALGTGIAGTVSNVGETLATIRTEVTEALGGRAVPPVRLNRWINQAYFEMATTLDLGNTWESFSFVVNPGRTILFPERVLQIRDAVLKKTLATESVEDRYLEYLSVEAYRKYPEASGYPDYYTFEGKVMGLYPALSTSMYMTVEALVLPAKLTDDTHSSVFGEEWDEALIKLSLTKAHDGLQEYDEAAQVYNTYLSHVRVKRNTKADQRSNEVAAFRPARSRLARRRLGGSAGDF